MTQMRQVLYGLCIDFLSLESREIPAQIQSMAWGHITQETSNVLFKH